MAAKDDFINMGKVMMMDRDKYDDPKQLSQAKIDFPEFTIVRMPERIIPETQQ